jgi:hypothetical protein
MSTFSNTFTARYLFTFFFCTPPPHFFTAYFSRSRLCDDNYKSVFTFLPLLPTIFDAILSCNSPVSSQASFSFHSCSWQWFQCYEMKLSDPIKVRFLCITMLKFLQYSLTTPW